MQPSTQDSTQVQDRSSAELSAVIEKLKACGNSDYELLIEHLETACAYLLGAMPVEAAHNLRMVRVSGKPLPDDLNDELNHTVARALKGLHSPASATPRSREASAFFQRAGVSFGIFYPTKHLVAVFPSFEAAQAGHQALASAGFRLWETIVVTGEEAEKFLEELRAHGTLWKGLMAEVSRLPRGEASVVDRYGRLAHTSAAFLVAYAPDESEAAKVSQILEPLDPVAMDWFMAGYIRHLI